MTFIRLNKYLSDSGICSRRKADEHILAGEVRVDGRIATLGIKINPCVNIVRLNNKTIKPKSDLVYYALYKPKSVISTSNDERDRKTVINLVPNDLRVYPVGRLDKDSEGLIILTNDGELTNLLTQPKNLHEKEYQVKVRIMNYESRIKDKKQFTQNIKKSFLTGLTIENKLMKVDKIELNSETFNFEPLTFKLVLHTGYNRQIRKMCDKMKLEVLSLKRTRVGKLKLSDLGLEAGQYKEIKLNDII